MDNEYMRVMDLFLKVMDVLLSKDAAGGGKLCAWSMGGGYANFKVTTFRVIVKQIGKAEDYRKNMKAFRDSGWIICKSEKFSNVQWINGQSLRVVTVDFQHYKKLKVLTERGTYKQVLQIYVRVIDKLIYLNSKSSDKRVCISSKNNQYMNSKSDNFRLLLKKECGEDEEQYRDYMECFRGFGWICCEQGKYSNIQKVDGKAVRVVSINYERYMSIKELLKETS